MSDHLEVRPATLRAAAGGVDGTADRFAGAVADLRAALAGVGDCWGGDEPGDAFGESYQPASRNLLSHVHQLYKHANRPSTIGNGTTMDAIRAEIAAGGGGHIQKGEEIARGLNRWLRRNPGASYSDRLVARSLYDELVDSLGYAP